MAEYQRQTAKKCRIGHLLQGNYVEQEGWEPNYVETEVGNISRVNVIGVVVSKDETGLLMDDGSGKIRLRKFDGTLEFEIGDKLLVIARPRQYNKEMFLAVEIAKLIENDKWIEFRKKELELTPKFEVKKKEIPQKVPEVVEEKIAEAATTVKTTEEIIDIIKKLDDGSGADIEEVIAGLQNGDNIVSSLLEQGEIFEVKPGRVKVLD